MSRSSMSVCRSVMSQLLYLLAKRWVGARGRSVFEPTDRWRRENQRDRWPELLACDAGGGGQSHSFAKLPPCCLRVVCTRFDVKRQRDFAHELGERHDPSKQSGESCGVGGEAGE